MTDKRILRAELRRRRTAFVAGLDNAERKRLLMALRDIVLPKLPGEGVVATYSAMGDEIDAAALVAVLDSGRVAYPYFADRDAPMAFRMAADRFEDGPFRIPQPTASAAEIEPDILLVPLIGGDPRCHRLGQGKGHYDRFLTTLGARKGLATIGLAWDVQIVDKLPDDIWDVPLDAIATPTRWIARLA